MSENDWINNDEREPEVSGYYEVKFEDGSTDEKPYRIRGNQRGWLTNLEKVVAWREI